MVFGEIYYLGSQLHGEYLFGNGREQIEVMIEREVGQRQYALVARLLPCHFIVEMEDAQLEVLFQLRAQYLYVSTVL